MAESRGKTWLNYAESAKTKRADFCANCSLTINCASKAGADRLLMCLSNRAGNARARFGNAHARFERVSWKYRISVDPSIGKVCIEEGLHFPGRPCPRAGLTPRRQ